MIKQTIIILKPRPRGFHLVTKEITSHLPELPAMGLLHLFVKHTSCGLAINENFDSSVRYDMEDIYNRIVPEHHVAYRHIEEGTDDMPSHAKSVLTGVSLTIPITNGKLNLGIWQGIYLCEFDGPRQRTFYVKIMEG